MWTYRLQLPLLCALLSASILLPGCLTPSIPCVDTDGDGYYFGNTCEYEKESYDCDQDALRNPAAVEVCNGVDDDCDTLIDDDDSVTGLPTWYPDQDHDGYGSELACPPSCAQPSNSSALTGDCNDEANTVHPEALELCNGIDEDCDGLPDDELSQALYFLDGDGDGHGDPTHVVASCMALPGYVLAGDDCDDADETLYPDAPELCNYQDDDCDGLSDEDFSKTLWYRDADGDTYGNLMEGYSGCPGSGYVPNASDCNDRDPQVHPSASEQCNSLDDNCNQAVDEGYVSSPFYVDNDGDGYGSSEGIYIGCARPPGYVTNAQDCNDQALAIHPGVLEICNGLDDDCSGFIDDGLPTGVWFRDQDGDGYGDPKVSATGCAPVGYVASSTDCDDTQPLVYPGQEERCDGIDQDCDSQVDDGVEITWYRDQDGDGYGNSNVSTGACVAPSGYVTTREDCDDANPAIHPNALEICDGLDQNCEYGPDEGLDLMRYYVDADGDGYGAGNPANAADWTASCIPLAGYSTTSGDCNDASAQVNPGKSEICNGIDDDCDGIKDNGFAFLNYYIDADGDGYGAMSFVVACARPTGYVTVSGDCNDASTQVNPGKSEICNGIDDDCDGTADNGFTFLNYYIDADGDGYGAMSFVVACARPMGYVTVSGDCNDASAQVNPGRTETCNGIDDDCDGTADDGLLFISYYMDEDLDGYGGASVGSACARPDNTTSLPGDCDDGRSATNPGAKETCNAQDDDCDGIVDEGYTSATWYLDVDLDGYGNANVSTYACTAPSGYVPYAGDCNDQSSTINPGAQEQCNAQDDDCDGQVDDGFPIFTWYTDVDLDGYGNSAVTATSCKTVAGAVLVGGDCNDLQAAINPGAQEQCNAQDDDCDALIDEGVQNTWYPDLDGDGYSTGALTGAVSACSAPTGYVQQGGDCDDTDDTIYPNQSDTEDALDNDCDGLIDEDAPMRLSAQSLIDLDRDPAEPLQSFTLSCEGGCYSTPNLTFDYQGSDASAEALELVSVSLVSGLVTVTVQVGREVGLGSYDIVYETGHGDKATLEAQIRVHRGAVKVTAVSPDQLILGWSGSQSFILEGWNFDPTGPLIDFWYSSAVSVPCVVTPSSVTPSEATCEVESTKTITTVGSYQVRMRDAGTTQDCGSRYQDCTYRLEGIK